MTDTLSFEEAWPHIKAGKEFRFIDEYESWSEWEKLTLGGNHFWDLSLFAKTKFQINREPREFYLLDTEESVFGFCGCAPKDAKKIKVREVIE